jgi:LPXTG-site transpeptidase (sortase) family protein
MLYKYVKTAAQVPQAPKIKKKRTLQKRYLISSLALFSLGIGILFYSAYPYLSLYKTKLQGKEYTSKYLLSPSQKGVASAVIQESPQSFSSNYISNVNRNFSAVNKLLEIDKKTFPEYANIEGEMKLSIPKLKLDKVRVKLNVNSFDEKSYLKQLEETLAHFQGTSLPDKPGNTFIYGHSANELLAKTAPNNPRYIFSFLREIDIGDEIKVIYNEKEYIYSVQNIKIVPPEDLSPIYTTSDSRILTLMTCDTPGVGNNRLIVTSQLIDEKQL